MKHFCNSLLFYLIMIGCAKTSKYLPESANNQLPEYSESGRNVGGALFNDTTWRCNVYISSLSGTYLSGFWIMSNLSGDSTTIIFNGTHSCKSIPFIDTLASIPINIFFVIKGLKIQNQDSLLNITGKTFYLDGINNYGAFTYSNDNFSFKKLGRSTGYITFDKVQKDNSIVFGNGTQDNPFIYRFIVSGHFNFTVNGLSEYRIEKGRFDMVTKWKTNLNIYK